MNAVGDMGQLKLSQVASEAGRRERLLLATLGADVRTTRRRRHWTQRELARRAGLSQPTVSELERGLGGSLSLLTWERLAVALDRPLVVHLSRDPDEEPADAGHLALQELVLRSGRTAGYRVSVEAPTGGGGPRSADVVLRDDATPGLVLVECWNTIGDVGGSIRSFDRKLRDLDTRGACLWPERAGVIAGCWVVRATRGNRDLVARYPEVFAARFPASSRAWVTSLERRGAPPREAGLVWCDVAAKRLFPWRRVG